MVVRPAAQPRRPGDHRKNYGNQTSVPLCLRGK
jgi:hypothetical protein